MVHTFSALGRNLAVDVNSGAVHVLDKLCCDLLSLVEGPMGDACPQDLKDRLSQYDARELDEAWTELLELQRAGLLFSDDDYIDPAAAMALPKAAVVKALCLHVSHDCNLRCRYCFASTGDFGTGHRMTMDFDTARRAIDWVVEKSGKRRNIEVDFFGGEPLMALDTVKRTVEYARSLEEKHDKCFRFTITTNGVLLDQDTIDYINREMSNVVLSLDGRREVNDHMRPTVNGKGSYDVIVPKFQQLVSQRGTKDYYVRGTFTRENLDFADDVEHLASLGFRPVVYDDRPEFADPALFPKAEKTLCGDFAWLSEQVTVTPEDYVVVMTRGHQADYEVLTQVLRSGAKYLGCIGSKRKLALCRERLLAAGFTDEEYARLHAPIGLAIGAQTPEEIAVSVAAEMIAVRAGLENGLRRPLG